MGADERFRLIRARIRAAAAFQDTGRQVKQGTREFGFFGVLRGALFRVLRVEGSALKSDQEHTARAEDSEVFRFLVVFRLLENRGRGVPSPCRCAAPGCSARRQFRPSVAKGVRLAVPRNISREARSSRMAWSACSMGRPTAFEPCPANQ